MNTWNPVAFWSMVTLTTLGSIVVAGQIFSLIKGLVRDKQVKTLRAAVDRSEANRRQLIRLTAELAAYSVRCEEILGELQRVWTSPENHEIVDNVDALQAAWFRVAESRPPLTELGRLLTEGEWRAIEARKPNNDRV
jgi:chromatin segregation and condensation protein Rec8/ScpA/Scc1 (kleisin family)